MSPDTPLSRFPSSRLDGKVAVITGASSGIGAAIAEAMAEAGARLVLVGRDERRLRETAAAVGEHRTVAADITADDAPDRIVAAAVDAFGSINCVVHSAGVLYSTPFAEAPLSELDEQWRVNVRAPFALTQRVLPHLRSGDSVIFMSSIAGHIGFAQSTGYCATKGAIELMVKSLAVELAPGGIRVNALSPGNIRTALTASLLDVPGYEDWFASRTPAGRVGEVEDVAPAVVFLASDAARYFHGSSLLVDGGWTAQ